MKKQIQILSFLILLAPLAADAQSKAKQQELDAYYQKKSEENAALQAAVTAAALTKKYGGDAATEKRLSEIILNYSKEADKLMAAYKDEALKTKLTELALSTDSLKQELLLMETGASLAESGFSKVLKYKRPLGLTQAQVDTLSKKAVKLEKLQRNFRAKNPGLVMNIKPLEAEMDKILTDEQYTRYLLIKNKDQALSWAIGDWADMKLWQITGGLDSAKTVLEIMNFNMNRLMLKDKYANDPAKLSLIITERDKFTPESLTRLRSAKAHSNPTGANAKKPSFTW